MRHAKSDWSAGTTDHARGLNARGQRTAPAVAAALVQRGWAPDAVWSSDSTRTRETWQLMAEHLEGPTAQFSSRLYLAEPRTIFGVVGQFAPGVQTALVLAHNPGISEAAGLATAASVLLRTADAALLEQAGDDWSEAAGRPWRLVDVIRGRDVAP